MRIFQPIITGSAVITGNLEVAQGVTGSFTGSLTGSLYGTASWAISSSHALTASYALNAGGSGAGFPFTGSAEITGSLIVTGSILATQSYISTVDYIDFTTTADPAHLEGRIHWIDDTKTLNVDTDVNNFSVELGHQNVVRVNNQTGATLTKGTIVYIDGENGNRPTVATASWEMDSSSATTIGWVAQNINDNQNGYVLTGGILRGINTTAYAPGTSLYLSSSGQYTSTVPVSPKHEVRLGKTITQAVDGSVFVYIMNGYEIGELHDVLINSKSNGDLITWDSGSNVWKNTKTLSGSYTVSGSLNVNVNGSDLISADSTNGLLLRNLAQDVVLDVDGGTAYDNIQIDLSIDWFNRKLYRSNNIAPPLGGTYTVDWENGIFSGSLHGTSSWSNNSALLGGANRNTFITTGSSGGSQAITGSLTITQNLTVLGSSSIQYITSSQLVIEDNIISVNTITPAVRYGGISVIDSGSSPVQSGSLLFDSQNNQWVFVHQSSAGAALTSSVLIMGPQTFNNLGSETTITANRLTKGTGGDLGEHIGDSNITDTGTNVSINSNTQITGSLAISGSATGSIFSVSASYIDFDFDSFLFSGSTVFQSALDATQASATFGTASITFGTVSGSFTGSLSGSLFGTSSWSVSSSRATTSSFAITASYALSAAAFPFTGSAIITGSLTTIGRNTLTGSFSVLNSESVQFINQGLTHPATTGSRIYQTTIAPVFTTNSPNQTSTALRLNPTFTGSYSGSNTQNLIVDFGATNVGSQFTVNDTTSGSIYMVNDVSGLPIIEATSNWDVNIYDYPNTILKKTGSLIHVSGSLKTQFGISGSNAQTTSSIVVTVPSGSSTQDYNVGITKFKSFSYLTTTRPIYRDNYISLGYDSAGNDPELTILTDPASGRVQSHAFSTTATTISQTSDINVASGTVDIYTNGIGSDMRLDITVSAGADANYPFYRIVMFRSNTTYGGNITVLVERFFPNL